jgi:hypothetical protein
MFICIRQRQAVRHARNEDGLCANHDPAFAEQKLTASRRGGFSNTGRRKKESLDAAERWAAMYATAPRENRQPTEEEICDVIAAAMADMTDEDKAASDALWAISMSTGARQTQSICTSGTRLRPNIRNRPNVDFEEYRS